MPISTPRPACEPSAAVAAANRRGVSLRARGRTEEAVAAFREALDAGGQFPQIHANLGDALAEAGRFQEAEAAFRAALELDSSSCEALGGLASLFVRCGRFDDARRLYDALLSIAPENLPAHLTMYELEQIACDMPKALEHQRQALRARTLYSEYAPHEQRRVLALFAPGDWQANVPIDFLIDRRTTTLHKLYVIDDAQLRATPVPQADVLFTAIAQSDENTGRLELAAALARDLGLPVVNRPERVLAANRTGVWQAVREVPRAIVPQTQRVTREELQRGHGLPAYPLIVRPVDSQAGRNLEKADDAAQLRDYLNRVDAAAFYVMPFVDFKSSDGYYRKYRIFVVDGVPYPVHLAISPRWMIHYYNAPMREHDWMRAEEERFLSGFDALFGPDLQRALRGVAQMLELDYVGVDCSIDREGRLLIFEADPAMIVHAMDDPQMFGYKRPHAERIFAAFERLVDRARSR